MVLLLFGAGWLATKDNANNMDDQDSAKANLTYPPQRLSPEYAGKVAKVRTTQGAFTISFFDNDAPKTVENFVRLAQAGKYNGTPFHRVIKGFMIQTGDFVNGNGTGGQSIFGETFADELYTGTASYQSGYKRGVVAMANAGPDTNGSQFFIMHADYPLPPNYTIFGQVIDGLDVIDKIANVPVLENIYGEASVPTQKIIIESMAIENK